MGRICKIIIAICCGIVLCGCQKTTSLDADNPVTIKVWNYYTGDQLEAFSDLVTSFNDSKGKELGVIVESTNYGDVTALGNSVLDAAHKKVGAKDVPHIFAAYPDMAYTIDQEGLVIDLSKYLTDEEINEYVDGYIDEGKINFEGLKIFPTAKSTELLMINKTDFDTFASKANVSYDDLKTIEGITSVAQKYYEYTDGLTSTKNDGKAFFGRDAVANYIIIGLKQFGHDIISVKDNKVTIDFDKETMRKIWDNYYIPYISGYFTAQGRFRTDDVKIGNVLAYVGSSSGTTFFPNEVIIDDETSYHIEGEVMEAPLFKDGDAYAVQQGAGMVVTKSDEAHEEASVEFLKWFTSQQQNISFTINSGYLPVKKESNNIETIEKETQIESDLLKKSIETTVQTVNTKSLYTTPAIKGGSDFRSTLTNAITDKCTSDRHEVENALKKGNSLKSIIARYNTDQNFNEWYEDTYSKLKEVINEETE